MTEATNSRPGSPEIPPIRGPSPKLDPIAEKAQTIIDQASSLYKSISSQLATRNVLQVKLKKDPSDEKLQSNMNTCISTIQSVAPALLGLLPQVRELEEQIHKEGPKPTLNHLQHLKNLYDVKQELFTKAGAIGDTKLTEDLKKESGQLKEQIKSCGAEILIHLNETAQKKQLQGDLSPSDKGKINATLQEVSAVLTRTGLVNDLAPELEKISLYTAFPSLHLTGSDPSALAAFQSKFDLLTTHYNDLLSKVEDAEHNFQALQEMEHPEALNAQNALNEAIDKLNSFENYLGTQITENFASSLPTASSSIRDSTSLKELQNIYKAVIQYTQQKMTSNYTQALLQRGIDQILKELEQILPERKNFTLDFSLLATDPHRFQEQAQLIEKDLLSLNKQIAELKKVPNSNNRAQLEELRSSYIAELTLMLQQEVTPAHLATLFQGHIDSDLMAKNLNSLQRFINRIPAAQMNAVTIALRPYEAQIQATQAGLREDFQKLNQFFDKIAKEPPHIALLQDTVKNLELFIDALDSNPNAPGYSSLLSQLQSWVYSLHFVDFTSSIEASDIPLDRLKNMTDIIENIQSR